MDGTITSPVTITVDNKPIPHENVTITAEGQTWSASDISDANPAPLKVNVEVNLSVTGQTLPSGEHEIGIAAATKEYGDIEFTVKDSL